jgi:hypothetical protein
MSFQIIKNILAEIVYRKKGGIEPINPSLKTSLFSMETYPFRKHV